jgi:hypothetical protein
MVSNIYGGIYKYTLPHDAYIITEQLEYWYNLGKQ